MPTGGQIVVQPAMEARVKCPRGYVSVEVQPGVKACVWKPVARAMGMWKPRKKPPISSKDWTAFQRAQRVEKKLGTIAKKVGYTKRRR